MNPIYLVAGIAAAFAAIGAFVVASKRSRRPISSFADRFDIAELVKRLDVPENELCSHVPGYREATIPKRSGGVRNLLIPDDATKFLQRRINQRLLRRLDAHPLACGFEEDTSIVDAAIPHVCRDVVIRVDIENFFESTTAERLHNYFIDIGWKNEAAALLVKLTTHNGHLPQGAPTSPRLSNLVNAPLDSVLLALARKYAGAYSRYADDITMSFGPLKGPRVRRIIQLIGRRLKPFGYRLNHRKTRIRRRHQKQLVLGLVVNDQVAIPRKTRRWLRAVRHRMSSGKPTTLTEAQLEGWTAFEAMVERQRDS